MNLSIYQTVTKLWQTINIGNLITLVNRLNFGYNEPTSDNY